MPSPSFVGRDDATRGDFFNPVGPVFVYGEHGFQVPSASSFPGSFMPSYVSGFSVNGSPSDAMFLNHISDRFGLLRFPDGDPEDRYYPLWYKSDFSLSFTTSQATRLGVYNRDNDVGRVQTISVLDGGTDAVLDSRTIEDFNPGAWLAWDLPPGSYKVRGASDTAAIICAVMWGPPGSPPAPSGRLCALDGSPGLAL